VPAAGLADLLVIFRDWIMTPDILEANRQLMGAEIKYGMERLRGKGTLYELGTEITCMMRGPGTVPGTEVDNLMQNIDYVPTFLDAAGGDYTPKEMIFSEQNWHGPSNDPMRSVRTARYHLIKNFESYPSSLFPSGTEPRDEIELFDREKDPYDWHNVCR
jgi:hypothetical protein